MCEVWGVLDNWVVFVGVVLAAIASIMLALNATSVFGHLMEFHADSIFRGLYKHDAKLRKAIKAAEVHPLLADSETIAELKGARLRGARWVLDPVTKLNVNPHDRIRRTLGLDEIVLTNSDGLLVEGQMHLSKSEIDSEIDELINNPRALLPSAARWAFVLLLLGSILLIIGSVPFCA